MGFGRAGSSDGRRRRVLLDEVLSSSADGESDDETVENPRGRKGRGAGAKRYSDQALPENQPRISCLLPGRSWVAPVIALWGLLVIGGLESVYYCLWSAGADLPQIVSVFDVTAANGLATWFSSVMFFASAAVALIVFALRRHRLDDYRGRYRLWLWYALALLIASVDRVTGLHHAIGFTAQMVLKNDPLPNPAWWWIGLYLVLGGLGGIRLAIEVSASRLAALFLVGTLTAAGVAVAFEAGWTPFALATQNVVVGSSAALAFQWFLFLTLLTYGRYVHLDAQGLIGRKARKKQTKSKRAKSADASKDPETGEGQESAGPANNAGANGPKQVRIDAAHLSSPPKEGQSAREEKGREDKGRGPLSPHFSKSERKQEKAGRR